MRVGGSLEHQEGPHHGSPPGGAIAVKAETHNVLPGARLRGGFHVEEGDSLRVLMEPSGSMTSCSATSK